MTGRGGEPGIANDTPPLAMLRLVLLAALAALVLPASAQEAPAHNNPSGDGIHVIGEWTMILTDANGVRIEERAFHNDLESALLVAYLLAGDRTSAGLMDILGTEGGSRIVLVQSADLVATTLSGDEASGYMYVEGVYTNGGSADVVLTEVHTGLRFCGPAYSPEECEASAGLQGRATLTRRTLDQPLTVAPGQSLNVRVEISFE